jgi:RNA polymerase primary sigma factor
LNVVILTFFQEGDPTQQLSNELGELVPYLRSVGDFQALTRQEEHAIAVRARRGDVSAKKELVRRNLGLVVTIARKHSRGAVQLDDLVQEGNLGLMRAAEKFDPHVGTRFSTYAVWWIRAYIGRYLKEARSNVKPRSGAVAQEDVSLDSPVDEEGEVTHLERLVDQKPGPEDASVSADQDQRVRQALARIRKRVGPIAWDIIHDRLQRDPPVTLQEMGERWGVSRERARQIEVATRRFLERHLRSVRDAEDLREAA